MACSHISRGFGSRGEYLHFLSTVSQECMLFGVSDFLKCNVLCVVMCGQVQ